MVSRSSSSAQSTEDKSTPFSMFSQMTDPTRWLEAMQQWQGHTGAGAALAGLPTGTRVDPDRMLAIQRDYTNGVRQLWQGMLSQGATPALPDRRFAGEAWTGHAPYAFTAAFYLLNARAMLQMAEAIEGEPKVQQRIRFAVSQWVDAMSPANFLATNPEAQQALIESHGESLQHGIQHMLEDLGKGKISHTDDSAFEVGRNLAVTPGDVIYENEYFQLIQYHPLTDKVFARPLLIVPPCINKFYVLDLQPENSLVRYAVEQGHTVMLVSWRNPGNDMADRTWDDYIEHAAIQAIHVTQAVSRQKQINVLGFCVGGTILSTALAVLAARGEHPAASLTLLTAMLDFTDTGVLDVFVDEAHVALREHTIGGQGGTPAGILHGTELANTFSFLRPNDLVWNYVIDNYLKGKSPTPFDILYWNGDSTNLPGPWYCWYLRHTYLQNDLMHPGRLTVCGAPVDFGQLDMPVYLYGSREDHIVPWTTAYASAALLPGDKRFVLGASGHIAGVINPPAKKKRSYWTAETLPVKAEAWLASAQEHPGSWWTDWSAWLAGHGGARKAAPRATGNAQYQPIEPAPGRYVKARA
ncbi:class I poly(R)-hydroxyalkanoic acid synthase [Imbroritus primus]|uniref:class I poly(R)-hydroxyalkanoic acid synthase n=1 Tax=Imbroritus primus TaxID=3058603 RepID=UPI003D1622F9